LAADPTSQGFNLRGIGPSGVSRSLVLMDGVPLNDGFGGWVYWRALPRLVLSHVEVAPGGGSALFGSAALGGVLQLFARTSHEDALEADLLYGSQQTWFAAARAAHDFGRFGAAVSGEWLRSEGYQVVAEDQRGAVDASAASEHGSIQGRLDLLASKRISLWANLGVFREDQNGGTRLTNARVEVASIAAGLNASPAQGGQLQLSAFGRLSRFEQQRARIDMRRDNEQLSARQQVPSHDQGVALVYRTRELSAAGVHALTLGGDARHIAARSRERLHPAVLTPSSLLRRGVDGQQLLTGVFAQDLYKIRSWLGLEGSLRFDFYRTYAAERLVGRADDTRSADNFAPRQKLAITPRLGSFVHASDSLTLRGAAYRAFRAPTLNELYRPFQVGSVLTAANERLDPEFLWGGELGFDWQLADALLLRSTGFWNRLEQPISNVTLPEPLPSGATRQRKNLGTARIAGLESSLEWRLDRRFTAIAAYTWVDSRVTSAPEVPTLRGKRLPQDPAHRASLLLFFTEARWFDASLQVRFVGRQYEDDVNQLPMGKVWIVDASCSRNIVWKLELYAAAENLLNRTYLVGRAGIDTIGQPLAARIGLRIRQAL
jgi:outer membrane receptor protein involved in Fe transport